MKIKWEARRRHISAFLQSQPSGWTGTLDWHYAFTEVGQECETRTGELVPCLHHHIPDKSELLLREREMYQILQPPSRMDKIA